MAESGGFASRDRAQALLGELGEDFAVLPSFPNTYPPYDIVPLAPKRTRLAGWPEAILLDMDGTLTSTEPLCLRALDEVLRLATGHGDDPDWRGLDPKRDYPHLIGNSTTTHVEYVMRTYADQIVPEELQRHALEAALWALAHGTDPLRSDEATRHIETYGLGELLEEDFVIELLSPDGWKSRRGKALRRTLLKDLSHAIPLETLAMRVCAGIDIYYRWWHGALHEFHCRKKSHAVDAAHPRLIMPMPGVGAFLAIVHGLLGTEAEALSPMLRANLGETAPDDATARARLRAMGAAFAERPVQAAVVTAARYYEMESCLESAFDELLEEVNDWPVSNTCRQHVQASFEEKMFMFQDLVWANSPVELRLKPHRDAYTVALHGLGIEPDAYDRVLGIEDSCAGITALRAAGIGLAVAVPFEHSGQQDYSAASVVVKGGLPAVILQHGLFLPER